jgi:tetratricopeptide (TPR) repeat protein
MFASLGAKARSTANTLGKRNVDFDRPAPAEKDLEGIHTVAIGELEGEPDKAAMISGYLASQLSDSGRFALVEGAPEQTEAPGTAVVQGEIVQAQYSEREDSQSAKCGDKTCVTRTRIGTAVVAVNLSVVDASTGAVLVKKTLEERKESKTSARDSEPPSIDGAAILDEAAGKVAGDIFAVLSPHAVSETVFFETDNAAKSLKEGANRAMNGDLEGAIEAFEQGVEQAESKDDEKALAKARYNLGLALVIRGEYDEGLELLEQAQRPKSRQAWASVMLAAKQWKADAQRARAQWANGDGAQPQLQIDPAPRSSEQAAAEGMKMFQSLRATAGR